MWIIALPNEVLCRHLFTMLNTSINSYAVCDRVTRRMVEPSREHFIPSLLRQKIVPFFSLAVFLDFPKGNVLCEARHTRMLTNFCSESVDRLADRRSTMLTVDPGGGGGNQQSTVRGSTVNSEVIDNQHCQLLILGGAGIDQQSTVRWSTINTVNCWSWGINNQQWEGQQTVLIVDHLTVDCWPSHCWLLILPPRSTVDSVDRRSPHCWLLTLSLLWESPCRFRSTYLVTYSDE